MPVSKKAAKASSVDLSKVFEELTRILATHSSELTVSPSTKSKYGLEGKPGPATLKSWNGKLRSKTIPFAWISVEKSYVSYHLMSATMPGMKDVMSSRLAARMQGKSCFNFKTVEADLFEELGALTEKSLSAFRKDGFIEP